MRHLPLLLCMLTLGAGLVWQARTTPSRAEAPVVALGAAPVVAPDATTMTTVRPASAPRTATWQPAPLSVRARRLQGFDDPVSFPALPEPGPSDWLAQHAEEGQSLEEFLARARRDVTATRHTVRLQPLDDVATLGVDLAVLAEHLRAYYGLPVTVAAAARPVDLTTRVSRQTGRAQVLTTDVMRWLEGEITRDLVCVLALTTDDLYPEPSWNFVFGMASLHRGVGVFSFARMDPAFPAPLPDPSTRSAAERARLLRRCLKVVTHEVGHMFALEHCIERSCLMNGSNHAAEMDRTPLHLCPFCLGKVVHATRLDAVGRYVALAAFYRAHGLDAEAEWVDALLRRVPE